MGAPASPVKKGGPPCERFHRISISERTKARLARARRSGKVLGRTPYAVDMVAVRAKQKAGQSLRGIARDLGVSPALLVKRAKAR